MINKTSVKLIPVNDVFCVSSDSWGRVYRCIPASRPQQMRLSAPASSVWTPPSPLIVFPCSSERKICLLMNNGTLQKSVRSSFYYFHWLPAFFFFLRYCLSFLIFFIFSLPVICLLCWWCRPISFPLLVGSGGGLRLMRVVRGGGNAVGWVIGVAISCSIDKEVPHLTWTHLRPLLQSTPLVCELPNWS